MSRQRRVRKRAARKAPVAAGPVPTNVMPALWMRAAYDAAQTTDLNRRHWQDADNLSADAAASPEVRASLRDRARHEVANNSYARGIALTLANDVVGAGPRLQLLTGNDRVNEQVETDFKRWAEAVGLAEKLRTMRMARIQDGESFALKIRRSVSGTPVPLDLHLIEADQVTAGGKTTDDPSNIDGVVLDKNGRPRKYQILVRHPGGSAGLASDDYRPYPAKDVIHFFRMDRPGQHRGVPEITPAIPLFAQLRRYTLAVLSAAEAAADYAGVIHTSLPPEDPEDIDGVLPNKAFRLERNALLTLPAGWDMRQVDPKQPASTYAEFKREILNEIARCLNMPFNVAACNSSGYNYASGRLDHQTYFKSIKVDQNFTSLRVLDPLLADWFTEYAAVSDLVSAEDLLAAEPYGSLPHTWFWDGLEHVDPLKEANAAAVRLAHGTSSLPEEMSRRGVDHVTSARGAAKALGVTVAQYQALLRKKIFGTEELPDAEDEPEHLTPEEVDPYG